MGVVDEGGEGGEPAFILCGADSEVGVVNSGGGAVGGGEAVFDVVVAMAVIETRLCPI